MLWSGAPLWPLLLSWNVVKSSRRRFIPLTQGQKCLEQWFSAHWCLRGLLEGFLGLHFWENQPLFSRHFSFFQVFISSDD
jgi:hypothetical protein